MYEHHEYARKEQEAWKKALLLRIRGMLLELNTITTVCLSLACGHPTQNEGDAFESMAPLRGHEKSMPNILAQQ